MQHCLMVARFMMNVILYVPIRVSSICGTMRQAADILGSTNNERAVRGGELLSVLPATWHASNLSIPSE